MSNLVQKEDWDGWAEGSETHAVKSQVQTHTPFESAAQVKSNTSDIIFLGIILAILQLMDGVLTSIGVARFGIGIEGNPLLRALMAEFGHIQTLTLLKFLAIMIVIGLTLLAYRLPWIKNAMGALTCLYLVAAIIPWTYLLFIKPYI